MSIRDLSLPKRIKTSEIIPDLNSVVFVTVCTKDRIPWLANTETHAILKDLWSDCSRWVVGRYVIMPEHLHLFAAASRKSCPLDKWICYWKSMCSKTLNLSDVWQRGHWSHRLVSDTSYEEKWSYVFNNPVRAGLIENAKDWEFQGEIYRF